MQASFFNAAPTETRNGQEFSVNLYFIRLTCNPNSVQYPESILNVFVFGNYLYKNVKKNATRAAHDEYFSFPVGCVNLLIGMCFVCPGIGWVGTGWEGSVKFLMRNLQCH